MTTDKQPKGLGDVIENITKATGIKKLVEWAFGNDCGCRERKKYLNKLFPRKKNIECLTEIEYNFLKEFFPNSGYRINPDSQAKLLKVYNRIFNTNKTHTNCSSCISERVKELKTVIKAYENE
tara:strand:- start:155 stop:523 length:369 start_codon:yes stop_codon:yes gene_type:complete